MFRTFWHKKNYSIIPQLSFRKQFIKKKRIITQYNYILDNYIFDTRVFAQFIKQKESMKIIRYIYNNYTVDNYICDTRVFAQFIKQKESPKSLMNEYRSMLMSK